ncbi:hypothetical protein [Massilia sp. CF038]|uniref:hypothetical protein n=1 Tax=Massilia sp. CF038 TaxID=1881045 RepID=UPI0009207110|nr:hypothetical protein [Massilia sp. CF038]SHH45693.1 hypothetical protein SAMN05428948_4115 [Massilia sp. CF038]
MRCPKCAYQRLPTDTHVHSGVCPACGIAYQKYLDRQAGVLPPVAEILVHETVLPAHEQLRLRLLEMPAEVDQVTLGGRALAWTAFALWTIWFTLHGVSWEVIGSSFLHNVILPFHEFGHVLFLPFGRFMTILGGSLFQVLMPLGLMLAFLIKQRETFGASAMLWWAGQSLVDLSPYIRDAQDRSLPLVGGGGEESHDWGNLLTMLGWLDHTVAISRLCFGAGVIVMLAALVWGAQLLRLQYEKLQQQRAA